MKRLWRHTRDIVDRYWLGTLSLGIGSAAAYALWRNF